MATATGALWGVAAAGLLVSRLSPPTTFVVLALGAALGAGLAHALPNGESLRHPVLALVGAVAATLMTVAPEPTFFLLVPLVAAAAAWPLSAPPEREAPLPRWVLPAVFAVSAAALFAQSAHRHWTFASGGRDLG
ncbi:MAG TPA: hypothetical protein VFT38_19370, partial [Vicinamibacteria bacterium]|nr:hypothetical protein [Vicinamibacteria bacterium]